MVPAAAGTYFAGAPVLWGTDGLVHLPQEIAGGRLAGIVMSRQVVTTGGIIPIERPSFASWVVEADDYSAMLGRPIVATTDGDIAVAGDDDLPIGVAISWRPVVLRVALDYLAVGTGGTGLPAGVVALQASGPARRPRTVLNLGGGIALAGRGGTTIGV